MLRSVSSLLEISPVAGCDWAKGENTSKFAMYIETEENNNFNNKDTKISLNLGDVSGSLLRSDLLGGLDGNDSFGLSLDCRHRTAPR